MEPSPTPPPTQSTVQRVLESKHADWMLGLISFTESSFLPIFVDPFIITLTLAKPERWWRYALIGSVTSVLGGVFGYILGAVFFEVLGAKIIALYSLEALFAETVATFSASNAFYFTFIGAFTPVPYKLVALVGGFLKINVAAFVLASVVGRSIRFFAVAFIAKQFGERALHSLTWRSNVLLTAVMIGVSLYFVMAFLK